MKLIGTFIILLAINAGGISCTTEQLKPQQVQVESIFQSIFRKLHQESPPQSQKQNRNNVQTMWITQKLDNFNEQDNRTWQMRYLANDEFFEEGGPLFIFVGGEWGISPGYITSDHWYDMAKEHSGYLFYTEHRYYGQSRPTRDLSNTNIKYLDVRQALADLAHFIRAMKSTMPGMSNSKVFLAGRSYSATMVIWFKQLYSDLVTGGWASGAPVFAKVDFNEYLEITGQSIRFVSGDACYERIQSAIAEMESMLANQRGAELKAILKICNNFDVSNDLDVFTLFRLIGEIFGLLVQYHDKGDIEGVCNQILTGDNDLNGFANYLLSVFNSNSCTDVSYKAYITNVLDTAYSDNDMRTWIYQTCNEFGWYETSSSRNQPFGSKIPVTLFTSICADAYGKQFGNEFIGQLVAATNKLFGGLSPNVKNIYMVHGQLDQWRSLGVQDETQITIIPDHAHCKDFDSISSSDTPELRASKEKIAALIREWMGTTVKA